MKINYFYLLLFILSACNNKTPDKKQISFNSKVVKISSSIILNVPVKWEVIEDNSLYDGYRVELFPNGWRSEKSITIRFGSGAPNLSEADAEIVNDSIYVAKMDSCTNCPHYCFDKSLKYRDIDLCRKQNVIFLEIHACFVKKTYPRQDKGTYGYYFYKTNDNKTGVKSGLSIYAIDLTEREKQVLDSIVYKSLVITK